MSKIEQLRKELNSARDRLVAKGWKWDGKTGNLMDIKPFEVAYQNAIEKVFPDYIWWKLTNYWDIFDAMASGIDDKEIIDEIVAHIDPSVLDEDFEESPNGAKIEKGHTLEEYMEIFGEPYNRGELWDFSKEDFLGGAVEINPDIVYWEIVDNDGETRYYETCEEGKCDDIMLEDEEATRELSEGASNFPLGNKFRLLAFYPEAEFEDMVRDDPDYPREDDYMTARGNGINEVDYHAYDRACEKFLEAERERLGLCILDFDSEETLRDRIDDFNRELENDADKRYDMEEGEDGFNDLSLLDEISLKVEPGYYEAAYVRVLGENLVGYMSKEFAESTTKRIDGFLEQIKREFGLSELKLTSLASNGETSYKVVEESKTGHVKKKGAKARVVGNPDTEKAFFNVANGTGTSCVLGESHKTSEEFCVMVDGDNVECYSKEIDAIAYAERLLKDKKMGKMLPNSNIRVLKVTYEDEVETAVECIWDSGDIDGFFYESKTVHVKKSCNTISK